MLSLRELRRAAGILEKTLLDAKVRRVMPMDEYKLVLSFESPTARTHVLISGKPEFARICTIENLPEPAPSYPSFYECARASLAGSRLIGIEVSGEDRQVRLRLQARSTSFVLILSILGTRSNIYLLDDAEKLMHSIRPLGDTRRELKVGEAWINPEGSVRSEGIDRWEEVPDDSYLQTIGKTYQVLEQKREAELLAHRIRHAIRKEQAFRGRKTINLQEDLGRAREAEAFRRKGELLKNVLHSIKPGARKAVATDYETGEVIEIPLDPKISPAANLASYFSRYHKESRGVRMIQQQLDDLAASCAELEKTEQELDEIPKEAPPDVKALEDLASRPSIRRLISRYSPTGKYREASARPLQKRELPARLLPKRYRTEDGLEIWVGRSDEGNDYLTTRLAHGNDLFFHLEGYPGSHVVLRTGGRANLPS